MSDLQEWQEQVTPFVEESLGSFDLKNVQITVTGKSEKGEGYIGDIIFVTVTGVTGSNEETEIYLVLKMGKKNKLMRETFSVRDIYLREVAVYDKIFPAFIKFQDDRGAKEIFNCVPKCYKSIVLDDLEILVFENLKKRGFELHDRQIPMNDAHIKFVLNKYAKLHGTSFAMEDLNKDAFKELTADFDCIHKKMMLNKEMEPYHVLRFEKLHEIIREADEELEKLFMEVFETGTFAMFSDVLNAEIAEHVIIHGDCWNNNFMFSYENGDKDTPTDIAILDWQLSSLHSPVLDLSYFLYIVSGEEQVAKFDEYLRFYHARLSEYMIELGSDPEKMFPYSTLMNHWEKYSAYGIIFLINSLELMLCDKDEALSLDDIQDTKEGIDEWMSKINPKNQSGYKERAIATVRHFCEHAKNNKI